MKKITLFATLISILFTISCSTNNKKSETRLLPWKISETASFEDFIDSIVVTPLDVTNEDSFIKRCMAMKVDNDKIYISDWFSKKIVSFNHDGSFNTKYGQVGKAINSGEYLEAVAFCTDDNYLYFIDNYNKKLFKYDKKTGKYVSNNELPNYYYDIETLDNGNFIFLWHPNYSGKDEDDRYKLIITDSELNIIQQLYKSTEDDGRGGKYSFFTKYDDKISYHAFYNDSIQMLDRKTGEKTDVYHLEIENKVPQNLKRDKDPYSDKSELYSHNFLGSNYGSPVVTDNYILGKMHNGKTSKSYFFFYDLKNEQYIVPTDTFPNLLNGQSFTYYNGTIYCCVSRDVIDEINESDLNVKYTKPIDDKSDFFIVKFAIALK